MSNLTLHPLLRLVVPFEWVKYTARDLGEGVHDVSAEGHVDVFGKVLHTSWAVLSPVGVVAHLSIR